MMALQGHAPLRVLMRDNHGGFSLREPGKHPLFVGIDAGMTILKPNGAIMSKSVMREKRMPVMKWFSAAMVSFVLLGGGGLHAAQIERENVDVLLYRDLRGGAALEWEDVYIPTREGVRQRLLIAKAANVGCKAVLLLPGGKGKRVTRKRRGRLRTTGNFLVRSSPLFARAGFVAVAVPAPSDRSDGMDADFRTSKEHHADMRAAVDFLVNEGACDVFLIGTSRGALSVAYLATVMTHPNVRGYVLTATLADRPPAVRFYAPRITDPLLMVHHSDDECHVTTYADAQAIFEAIPASARKGFITVSGGDTPRGRACGPWSAHGFIGAERETVAAIADWMNGKTPPAHVSP